MPREIKFADTYDCTVAEFVALSANADFKRRMLVAMGKKDIQVSEFERDSTGAIVSRSQYVNPQKSVVPDSVRAFFGSTDPSMTEVATSTTNAQGEVVTRIVFTVAGVPMAERFAMESSVVLRNIEGGRCASEQTMRVEFKDGWFSLINDAMESVLCSEVEQAMPPTQEFLHAAVAEMKAAKRAEAGEASLSALAIVDNYSAGAATEAAKYPAQQSVRV
eukprot:TRINITY_DN592_c0_g1_i1.p4 TRINITY_DN592_c0_g1~~TRINITY_DN592_c0_g1_i1.p4  ORF type:complete len:219 (-),score=61.99 TRINITY_DN592_c0_g1_i1:152-808(-)